MAETLFQTHVAHAIQPQSSGTVLLALLSSWAVFCIMPRLHSTDSWVQPASMQQIAMAETHR